MSIELAINILEEKIKLNNYYAEQENIENKAELNRENQALELAIKIMKEGNKYENHS